MKKHRMIYRTLILTAILFIALVFNASLVFSECSDVPDYAAVSTALSAVVAAGGNEGLGNNMWATVVDRDGIVCAVARTGVIGEQWPGSRVISAQKANTANAFSLPGLALSTANLYSAVQPGGSLFGLQESNPVNPVVAYAGKAVDYGTIADPMVNEKIGGVNVFGGGLSLYNDSGKLVGAIGVSGDTSCTDHITAWKVRDALGLDRLDVNPTAGVSPTGDDNIIFDITRRHHNFQSKSGFGHPECGFGERPIAESLPTTHPVGP
ncbi:MAG: heme-binding protein [Nitrospinota bacterium]